jgi:deoxyribonuclease IV
MLLGVHVSPAGGPAKAVQRGAERGARAIQIFNQNPRAWKPTPYDEAKVAAYHGALRGSGVEALLIHAVYLLNCASEDPDIVEKSRASLIGSLRAGEQLGAAAVVLHPGSALQGEVAPAIARAGQIIREALSEAGGCPLHLENTAGAGGTLGRSFEELAALLDAAGGDGRIGVCLDSCHLFASGFDVRTDAGLAATLDDFDRLVGLDRLGSLHLNDSQVPLGANRDRHAILGEGELGEDGFSTWLSEPRFDGLPCVLETPGSEDPAESRAELERCAKLRRRGLARRRRAAKAA